MKWSRLLDGQVMSAIERPAGFAASTVLLGVMAGIELTELLDQPSHIHKYVFAFLFGLFAIWHAYILARAIRQLRDNKMGADSD